MIDKYKLFTASGSGGMIVEIAFALAKIPIEIETVDWDDLGWDSSVFKNLNPLGQLPTMVKPDGAVMTESAAMIQHIADRSPDVGLVPDVNHPARDDYSRWLAFLNAAVYPTFTYGDVPTRWAGSDEQAAAVLKKNTDEHRKELFLYLETYCGEPWFLGDTFSAVDLYFWPMRHWRPGKDWFDEHCPRLSAVSQNVDALTVVREVAKRNGLPSD